MKQALEHEHTAASPWIIGLALLAPAVAAVTLRRRNGVRFARTRNASLPGEDKDQPE